MEEYERLSDPGAKGPLLRREGLYSSHIVEWRRAREVGALAGLGPKARRPKASALEKESWRALGLMEALALVASDLLVLL